MTDAPLAFGPFRLDTARGMLTRDGAPVALGQRALAVLAALAEAPGRTVTKEALLARAWPGTIVEEGNLTVQIASLRKALGPDHDWIVTVPRSRLPPLPRARRARAGGAAEPRRPSLRRRRRAGLVRRRDRRGHHRRTRPLPQLRRRRPQLGLRLPGAHPRHPRGRAASSGSATFWKAASGAPATGSASPQSSSTARPAPSSGPRASTARWPRSSTSRTASPRRWRCSPSRASRPPRSRARGASAPAASPPTTSTFAPLPASRPRPKRETPRLTLS